MPIRVGVVNDLEHNIRYIRDEDLEVFDYTLFDYLKYCLYGVIKARCSSIIFLILSLIIYGLLVAYTWIIFTCPKIDTVSRTLLVSLLCSFSGLLPVLTVVSFTYKVYAGRNVSGIRKFIVKSRLLVAILFYGTLGAYVLFSFLITPIYGKIIAKHMDAYENLKVIKEYVFYHLSITR